MDHNRGVDVDYAHDRRKGEVGRILHKHQAGWNSGLILVFGSISDVIMCGALCAWEVFKRAFSK